MHTDLDRPRVAAHELASRVRADMVPLGQNFYYFCASPVADEDLKQYLQEPIAAIPLAAAAVLPRVNIVLVPFLEKSAGRGGDSVCYEKPPEHRQVPSSIVRSRDSTTLFFAIKDEEVSDYHYEFYSSIGTLVAVHWTGTVDENPFFRLLREELSAEVHGEVDERSWHLKQALLRRAGKSHKESKLFRDYAQQSFADTLTLYLHGICCDIDVETGPRQVPSRYLRKRLETLQKLFPPPDGHSIFPDESKRR